MNVRTDAHGQDLSDRDALEACVLRAMRSVGVPSDETILAALGFREYVGHERSLDGRHLRRVVRRPEDFRPVKDHDLRDPSDGRLRRKKG